MGFEDFLGSIDTIFYGRVSYESWGNFQPEENATATEQALWKEVHSKKKFVFSSREREERGATFISTDIEEQVARIKEADGKDIWLYGGAGLIKTFIDLDLIDVFKLSVHPVVLGAGKPLFEDLQNRIQLRLLRTNTFRTGVVQLIYEPSQRS